MKLKINGDRELDNPGRKVLSEELPTVGLDEFAVLEDVDQRYVQFYRNPDGSFDLEVREGSAEQHFAVAPGSCSIEDLVAGFTAYVEGTFETWKLDWTWTKVDFEEDFEGDDGLTHYVLDGKEYHRVRVGMETGTESSFEADACGECNAPAADYHQEGCPLEECPRCHGISVRCSCE